MFPHDPLSHTFHIRFTVSICSTDRNQKHSNGSLRTTWNHTNRKHLSIKTHPQAQPAKRRRLKGIKSVKSTTRNTLLTVLAKAEDSKHKCNGSEMGFRPPKIMIHRRNWRQQKQNKNVTCVNNGSVYPVRNQSGGIQPGICSGGAPQIKTNSKTTADASKLAKTAARTFISSNHDSDLPSR